MLINHVKEGNELSLADDLKIHDCFKSLEERFDRGKLTLIKVPKTAHVTFAQGEFNRFYIRALCIQAIEQNKQLEVYRARLSENPRLSSKYLIGTPVNAKSLLSDLRNNIGIDTALGLPNGSNSGLSVKFSRLDFPLYQ